MLHRFQLALALGVISYTSMTLPAAAQPSNHLGEPAARILIGNACAMKESDLADAMKRDGWHISDFQAQVMGLYRGGYLTSGGQGVLKLVNWPPCRG